MSEYKKSTCQVEIVPVEFTKHPNADALSITQVFGGYTYVGRTDDWRGIERAAYIPPDNMVDCEREEFRFLRFKPILDSEGNLVERVEDTDIKTIRIKAKKLRGIISFGLMIPVPNDTPLGGDWAEKLGVRHYEPETDEEVKAKGKLNLGGENESGPADLNTGPYYDIDAARRFGKEVFVEGEQVVVTEKLDGSNCRVVWHNDRLWVKSREHWRKRQADHSHLTIEGLVEKGVPADKAATIIAAKLANPAKVNGFWQVIERTSGLVDFCKEHPGTVVFGEIYGSINKIRYGLPEGNRFAAFDVMQDGQYLNALEAHLLLKSYDVPTVPVMTKGFSMPFNFDSLCEMAEGLTTISDAKKGTIREGIVVVPIEERYHRKVGRVKLKFVSGGYLEKHR